MRPTSAWFLPLLTILALTLSACKSPQPASPRRAATVDELNLLAMPVALSFDHTPGADGFMVKVYAGSRAEPKPVRITSGTLDVMMYDGVVPGTGLLAATPLRVWSFPASELGSHETKTSIGIGYDFELAWEEHRPRSSRITVTARYTSPEGRTLYAAPTPIAIFSP